MTKTSSIDVPIGLRSGPFQAITQSWLKDEDSRPAITLPALVRRSGSASLASVQPLARLFIGESATSLLVTADVPDTAALGRQIEALLASIGTRAPLDGEVKIETRAKAGDLLDKLYAAAEGCGCKGGGTGGIAVRATLTIGLSAKEKGKLSWSKPIPARLKLALDSAIIPLEPAEPVGFALTICESEWLIVTYQTVCHDKGCGAAGKSCDCGKTPGGVPLTVCDGWKDCACK